MARARANDYEVKQRRILETAATVFARMGMEKASMSGIARELGNSKALLYHYYSNKNALIYDIILTHLGDLDSALAEADQRSVNAEEKLEHLVCTVMELYKDADDKHKVQLECIHTLSSEQIDEIKKIERRIIDRFSTVLARINPDLTKDRTLLMPITMTLFGILNSAYMWFRDQGPISRAEYASLVSSLFLNGIKSLQGSINEAKPNSHQ